MQQLQDDAIIELVLQGNTHAYAVLIERYQHLVFTLILQFIPNREDAEEVTQDVFIKAFRSLSQYKHNSKFSTWVYTITRNTAISYLRQKKQTVSEHPSEEIRDPEDTPATSLEQKTTQQIIRAAINRLPKEDALVMTLFYIHEQTVEETAIILNLTKENIKIKLYRSRKKLKDILDNYYQEDIAEYKRTNQ